MFKLLPGPTINSPCWMEVKGFEANRLSVHDFCCLHPAHKCSFLCYHTHKPSSLVIIVFTPEIFGLNADASQV